MKESPLVTIGLTCFNLEKTIERALKSAINQDWENKEIILIDDCSTDNSKVVLLKLKSLYPQVQIINNIKHCGVAYNRNLITKKAKGEFIAFFDGDDESHIDRITKQYKRFLEYKIINPNSKVFVYLNRNVILVDANVTKQVLNFMHQQKMHFPEHDWRGQYDVIPANANETKYLRFGIGRMSPEPYGKILADKILVNRIKNDKFYWGSFGAGTLFTKVSYIKDLNGYDENFGRHDDTDLVIRAAIEGYRFISVNETLMTQYITRGVHKILTTQEILSAQKQLIKKHHKYLKERFLYIASFFDPYAWYFGQKKIRIL